MTFGALLFDVSADNFRPSRYNKVPAGTPGLSTPSNVCPHTSAHEHTGMETKMVHKPLKVLSGVFQEA